MSDLIKNDSDKSIIEKVLKSPATMVTAIALAVAWVGKQAIDVIKNNQGQS